MKTVIITKWIEPYKLLETIKQYCEVKEFIFNGATKLSEKETFFKELTQNKNTVGLYMKNVNKYYLFTIKEEFDIWNKLVEEFDFTPEDFETGTDTEKPFQTVDMGKAEAGIIFPEN